MQLRALISLLFLGLLLNSCGWNLNAPDDGNNGTDPDDQPNYQNVTTDYLPAGLADQSNSAKAIDIDNNGTLDLVIAISLQANKILINDGNGVFSDETASRLQTQSYDTRGISAADFNTDGNMDLFFPNEQAQPSEFAINDGRGTFSDLSNRIPVSGYFTSSVVLDADADGLNDLFIGNRGQNVLLINRGNAYFNNQSSERLPQILDVTFDIAAGDVTNNGLADLVIANDETNSLLINNGTGYFTNQSANRIPFINAPEVSRDVSLVDVDGDQDLDIYFGNTTYKESANPQDRLLINDGQGNFSDQTASRLPTITTNTLDAEFYDLDIDGDYDLIAGNFDGGLRIFINDGNGVFSERTDSWIAENFTPRVTDLEIADFNNDNLPDIYIAVYNSQDQLLLQRQSN